MTSKIKLLHFLTFCIRISMVNKEEFSTQTQSTSLFSISRYTKRFFYFHAEKNRCWLLMFNEPLPSRFTSMWPQENLNSSIMCIAECCVHCRISLSHCGCDEGGKIVVFLRKMSKLEQSFYKIFTKKFSCSPTPSPPTQS
jgi:hypothetical protein